MSIDITKEHPLIQAAASGNLEILRQGVTRENVNTITSSHGSQLLDLTAKYVRLETFNFLIEQGADIFLSHPRGVNAIWFALTSLRIGYQPRKRPKLDEGLYIPEFVSEDEDDERRNGCIDIVEEILQRFPTINFNAAPLLNEWE